MSADATSCHIGLLLFPGMTQIDFAEPYEVFSRLPDTIVHVVAKTPEPVKTERGLIIVPTIACDDCPPLDVLVVPGGPGQQRLMEDEAVLGFLRRQAACAKYVTSVCTGALLLGAAGLLSGRRATTHWLSMPLLPLFGAIADPARVVRDGNLVSGGGVTAGIDMALTVVAEIAGAAHAQAVQLAMEYAPEPPFACGRPEHAPPEVVAAVRGRFARVWPERLAAATRAAALQAASPARD